jgi:hypothetical protein
MPADTYGLRVDRPEQILFEVRQYRLTLGSEARTGSAAAVQAGAWVHLEGTSLVPGSDVLKIKGHAQPPLAGEKGPQNTDPAA